MPEQRSSTDKIPQAITVTAGAAGSSNVNGAILDMSGWEGRCNEAPTEEMRR